MIVNDASGQKTVKYGEVADWVLELEVVTAEGELDLGLLIWGLYAIYVVVARRGGRAQSAETGAAAR